jgi:hypothetical protein
MLKHRDVNNIKMDLAELGCENVDCILLISIEYNGRFCEGVYEPSVSIKVANF